jgi:hypothetical protein
MLGIAKAAQYAGWASTKPTAKITVNTAVTQSVYQTPSFSVTATYNNSPYGTTDNYVDLTGYTSLPGFNNNNFTKLHTIYLPWTGGMSDGQYWVNGVEIQDSSVSYYNDTYIEIVGGSLSFYGGPANARTTLPGAYTLYINKWLTVVECGSNTTASFTNWSNTTGGSIFNRRAVYATETAALITKTDTSSGSTQPVVSSLGTTLLTGFGNPGIWIGGYPPSGSETQRISQVWFSQGTMFDPLSQPTKSWLTTRIPKTIGTGVAWMNPNFTTTTTDGGDYWVNEHNDSVINTAGKILQINISGYSTTIIPKDKS